MTITPTPEQILALGGAVGGLTGQHPTKGELLTALRQALSERDQAVLRAKELEAKLLSLSINGKWTTRDSVKYAKEVSAKERARAEQAEADAAQLREAIVRYGWNLSNGDTSKACLQPLTDALAATPTGSRVLERLKAAEAVCRSVESWKRWEVGGDGPPPNASELLDAWRRASEADRD